MLLEKEREAIAEYGRAMLARGLVDATGGNLSVYSRREKLVAISPSGVPYGSIAAADVPVVDCDKNMCAGTLRPSSEMDMHLTVYRQRDDISALIHTHSPCATTIACLRRELPAVHYLIGFAGGAVRCAAYATYGTEALAENACAAMHGRRAVLLANHGMLAGAADLADAFTLAEMVEYCADIYLRASAVGHPVILDDAEMDVIREKFKTYGRHDPR
jgi:L-fuculose-phosphate aldolase